MGRKIGLTTSTDKQIEKLVPQTAKAGRENAADKREEGEFR